MRIANAYFLARCSAAAYLDGQAFDLALAQLGLELVKESDRNDKDFRYFLASGGAGRFQVLSYRGTVANDVRDWLADATIEQVKSRCGLGLVHRGFSDAVQGASSSEWAGLTEALNTPAKQPPLWITGHSLGGAMATLAAAWLAECAFNVRALYTFGSPRVGDPTFAGQFGAGKASVPHWRFVNNADIVPTVPWPLELLGLSLLRYQHGGTEQWFGDDGRIAPQPGAWAMASRQIAATAKRWDAGIVDHFLDAYCRALSVNLPNGPTPSFDFSE